jgi:hypothetical protein
MVSLRKFLVVFTLPLGAGLAGLGWQYQTNATLRRELAQRQADAREQQRLESEHRRLQSAQVPPGQLAIREQDRAALAGLANELEILRRRAAAQLPATAGPRSEPTSPAPRPSLREAFLSAEQWSNAGDKDALSALETALWASARGEMSALIPLLSIDEATRGRVSDLLARLPDGARSELGSPEQAIALVTASAIPLGGAQVVAQFSDARDSTRMVLQLTDLDGRLRERVITLRATSDGWRLAVPDAAIDRYVTALRKPAGP